LKLPLPFSSKPFLQYFLPQQTLGSSSISLKIICSSLSLISLSSFSICFIVLNSYFTFFVSFIKGREYLLLYKGYGCLQQGSSQILKSKEGRSYGFNHIYGWGFIYLRILGYTRYPYSGYSKILYIGLEKTCNSGNFGQ